jgi:hypothetical protein
MSNTLSHTDRAATAVRDTLGARALRVGARVADAGYRAWQFAQLECELALIAWRLAGPQRGPAAHVAYRAALEREEAAARDFEELCRVTGALATS